MPGLTGHLFLVIPGLTFLVIPGLTFLVIPGLTRNLKTFKLKVKYFILLKKRNWFGYFSKRLYLCYGH